ncbi:MAG: hypothetical protein CBC50_04910 [Synechococcus sp. TMED90]|uniref:hypothetical protein n=1 Tax=Synechococcus sp. MEDNS5 TaxID=1442554 RepID=UPI000B711077|nr:hypothetical protein [Synechococcus sp. MEDNS5]OUX72762.1 MAG: hypothetical protein CBC50_04910 [Synechococcus sp. TMED90]
MPRYRCPECCCGPAIVLHPPKGSVPVCARCRTVMERQPLVRPGPLLVLLAVGSALIAISIPALLTPMPAPRPPASQTTA